MSGHDEFLDDVAVYALGAMSEAEAARIRTHIAQCATCRAEYEALLAPVSALALSAEACTTGERGPQVSPLLKRRIMRSVEASVSPVSRARAARGSVLPAYLVAAASLVLALLSGIADIALQGRLHATQQRLAAITERDEALLRDVALQRHMVADLMDPHAERIPVHGGEVVVHGTRIYLAMNHMPQPPKGKVYQTWTLPKGAKAMVPSVRFVPDRSGVAVVALPADARRLAAVAVSIEPPGGSKEPTSAPVLEARLIE
jgi:hypothetical protein